MSADPTSVTDSGAPTGPDGTDRAGGTAETFDCPYCGRRFAREGYRDLHLGQQHAERLDAAEREAYEEAHDAEAEAIRMFRLKALAVLVAVYFGFLMVYAFTL